MKQRTQFSLIAAGLMAAGLMMSGIARADGLTGSDSASVTAVVIKPITVEKKEDMVIGNLVPGNGDVTLSTTAARTKSGATPLSTSGGDPKAAKFEIDGEGANTFSIDYTDSSTQLSAGEGKNMDVAFIAEVSDTATNKTETGSNPTTGTLSNGKAYIHAGAKVTVDAAQAAGTYTGTLKVTVAYN